MIYNNFDDLYIDIAIKLLDEGVEQDKTVPTRARYVDGTEARTKSIEGVSFTITPEMGVPLLRSKRVGVKTPLIEAEWIWQEMSNDVDWLNNRNVRIWDNWAQTKRDNSLCYVQPKVYKTGSKEVISSKENCDRVVNGIGYYGDYKKPFLLAELGIYHKRWVTLWEDMINEYNHVCKDEQDVHISSEFQSCELFLTWVVENKPPDNKLLGILQLDKDYYLSDIYGPETCVLLTPEEKKGLKLANWYLYGGEVFMSLDDIIDTPLNNGDVTRLQPNKHSDGMYPRFSLTWNRTINRAYGWQLKNKTRPYRYFLNLNQVEFMLEELNNNPNSRRIMTTLWDVEDLDNMALEPCVWATHWTVHGGRLNLHVKQRSQDFCLGGPYNVYQYSILHRLVADEIGLPLGDLHWNVDNLHVYDRHIDVLTKQIDRYNKSGLRGTNDVTEVVLPSGDGFFNRRLSKTVVKGYEPIGSSKYEIAE